MKRRDSILQNYYMSKLPKYQGRTGSGEITDKDKLAILQYVQRGKTTPKMTTQQFNQAVSKPITQVSAKDQFYQNQFQKYGKTKEDIARTQQEAALPFLLGTGAIGAGFAAPVLASALPVIGAGLSYAPIAAAPSATLGNLLKSAGVANTIANLPNISRSVKQAFKTGQSGDIAEAILNLGIAGLDLLPIYGPASNVSRQLYKKVAEHPLVSTLPYVVKRGAVPEYLGAAALAGIEKLSPILSKNPLTRNLYKRAAEKIASQSFYPNRDISQIIKALRTPLIEPAYRGMVTSGTGYGFSPNRNLIRNYIYGDARGFETSNLPLTNLQYYTNRYGPLKKYKLDTGLLKDEDFPYESLAETAMKPGNFPFPEELAGANTVEDVAAKIKEIAKREGMVGIGSDASVVGYDDVGGNMKYVIYDPVTDSYKVRTQDIWKFTPKDYNLKWKDYYTSRLPFNKAGVDIKEYLNQYAKSKQASLMDKAGKPFVLLDERPLSTLPKQAKTLMPLNIKTSDYSVGELEEMGLSPSEIKDALFGKQIKTDIKYNQLIQPNQFKSTFRKQNGGWLDKYDVPKAQVGIELPGYARQYLSGRQGDMASYYPDIKRVKEQLKMAQENSLEKVKERVAQKRSRIYDQLRRAPGLKLYSDQELQQYAQQSKDKWPKRVRQMFDDESNIVYNVVNHPDYNPSVPVSSQRELADDNSLRTMILRGRNKLLNSGNPVVDFANSIITAPGSAVANIMFDSQNAYNNPNLPVWQNLLNTTLDVANILPLVGPTSRGVGTVTKNLWSSGIRNIPRQIITGVDKRVSPVGRQLYKIEQEGKAAGLSDWEIKNKQLETVGITSNQRKGYIPGVSELAYKYIRPYNYGDVAQSKFSEILENIRKGGVDYTKVLPQRSDAWRLYLGLPQKNKTFMMSTTSPIRHQSYAPGTLTNMDIYSFNPEIEQLEAFGPAGLRPISEVKPNIPSGGEAIMGPRQLQREIEILENPIIIDKQHSVMGGYNKRLNQYGLEYNDVWDLNPTLAGVKIPVSSFIGKPFMSHGVIPYTSKQHTQALRNMLAFDIQAMSQNPQAFGPTIDKYRQVLENLKNYPKRKEGGEIASSIYNPIKLNKKGGPIVNSNGYKDGRPSKGSNWRIPGNTVYNPTGETILAQANTGEQTILQPYDTNSVTFQGADYIDEYHLTDNQPNWLDDYKAKLGGPYNSSWMLTNPKPESVIMPKLQNAGPVKWFESWYSQRKNLPQFTRLAKERLNLLSSPPAVVINPQSKFREDVIAEYVPSRDAKKDVIYLSEPSKSEFGELGHEMTHWLDTRARQSIFRPRGIDKSEPFERYPGVTGVKIKESKLPENVYQWISTTGMLGNKGEVNAILNELRQKEGLKGDVPTTPEQMQMIINKYMSLPASDKTSQSDSRIKTLIKYLGENPEVLSDINNRIVKTKIKKLPKAQGGGKIKDPDKKWIEAAATKHQKCGIGSEDPDCVVGAVPQFPGMPTYENMSNPENLWNWPESKKEQRAFMSNIDARYKMLSQQYPNLTKEALVAAMRDSTRTNPLLANPAYTREFDERGKLKDSTMRIEPFLKYWRGAYPEKTKITVPDILQNLGQNIANYSNLINTGYRKFKQGGQHGGLDRWFAEKWVDVKSGKPCGRQEGENRAYPACRPSKRVSSKTPKTSSELSSEERARFKSTKTSSQRIPYSHKRRK